MRYRAIQCLMATTIRQDLMTGHVIDRDSILEDHHIFPRRLIKSDNFVDLSLDSIANRLPLLAESNRKLSDKEPKAYIINLINNSKSSGTDGDLKRRFSDSMIPMDTNEVSINEKLDIKNYAKFLEDRAGLILDRIGEVIGESLSRSGPSTDEEIDDEDA